MGGAICPDVVSSVERGGAVSERCGVEFEGVPPPQLRHLPVPCGPANPKRQGGRKELSGGIQRDRSSRCPPFGGLCNLVISQYLAVQPTLKREGGGRIKRQIEGYSKIDRSFRRQKRGGERVK